MATDRLRRRLGDAEHKTDASLKHDYCLIGTPLSALDSGKKDANELKPAWQQEVRDEQGRRRFHGAFTGGFSAGYFNTVGSKEGWTPSSFRSSRADKVNGSTVQNQARPEDFMDEEDLQDRKQNQQISMSNVFAQPSGKLNDLSPRGFDDVALIASAIYKETNASQLETLGFRLLRRMGWKEGQGLGARIDARKKQRLLSATSDDVKSLSETDLAAKHLFAPPQTTVPQVADHKHRHGLGWLPGTTLLNSQLSRVKFAPHVAPANNSLPVVRMAAQPDSDDEEDYFRDNEAWPVHARGKLDHGRTQTQIESGSRSQLTWRDGRKMLAGFQSSTSTEVAAPTHTTQLVPDAWTPDLMRVKAFLQAATLQTASAGPCGSLLTPAARGQVLGEAELPGPPPRMPAILVKYQNARSVDQVLKEQFVDVPRTDVATAKLALQGFMPFSNNPIKQGQYRSYLESQVRPAEEQARRQLVPPTHTQDDFLDLLDEFASSAAVSRLMSTTMANRFTSASATPSVNEQAFSEPGLRQPAPAQDSDEEHITTEEPRDLADTVQSAEVMAPDKTGKTCRTKIRADQHWQQNKEQLKAMAASSKPLSRAIEAKEMYLPAESTSMAQLGLGDDERQGSDTLSYARPSVDVYKAIFEPDDEEVETQVIPKQGDPPQAASEGSDLLTSVTFRARSRRKADDLDDATKTRETFNDQKRKKEKRKGMLSFDIEEEINRPVPKAGRASDTQASELKSSRIKAADMF